MSPLLNREKRNRARAARRDRRSAILEAARQLFARQPYEAVTLDVVGRRVGVAKGIASLHFATAEELFLEVLRGELAGWFDATQRRLEVGPHPVGRSALAAMLADGLGQRDELTCLFRQLQNVMQRNVELMPAQSFVDWLADRARALGETLEQHCEGFEPGDGAAFLRRLAVIVAGLRQSANPSGIFAVLLGSDDLAAFRVDPRAELETLIQRVLPAGDG